MKKTNSFLLNAKKKIDVFYGFVACAEAAHNNQRMQISYRTLAVALVALFGVCARGQMSEITRLPAALTPEEFPIFPWDHLQASKEAYEDARACGMNLVGFVDPKNLDLVASVGMKGFVADKSIEARNPALGDAEIEQRVKALVEKAGNSPAVFGYHIIDEPQKREVKTVAKWTNAFQAAAPKVIAYTNLLPIGAFGGTDIQEKFTDYVDSYVAATHPKAFSFDWYSMMDDGSIRGNYFECLEAVRRESIKNNVPFWNVCLGCAHFRYAEPSPATLRFQVFASMAYGARGIGWFTFTGRDRGNYRLSAIDLQGRHTPTWEMLRDANEIPRCLGASYLPLKSVNVFHSPDVPEGCQGISSSQFVKNIKGAGPFLVGEFTDPAGNPALLVVNRNLQHSTTWGVTLKNKATMRRVSALTGKVRAIGAEDDWLPPGGGILLLLSPVASTQP